MLYGLKVVVQELLQEKTRSDVWRRSGQVTIVASAMLVSETLAALPPKRNGHTPRQFLVIAKLRRRHQRKADCPMLPFGTDHREHSFAQRINEVAAIYSRHKDEVTSNGSPVGERVV